MYDTGKRVALVKNRMAEHHRRRVQPMDAAGMYGAILRHEGAGGYVLVAVISFTVAIVITVLCIKFGKKGQQGQRTAKENIPRQCEEKSQ